MENEVLYTCLKDHQKKFFLKGNPIGKCSCGGSWMWFRENNKPDYKPIVFYVNKSTYCVQLDFCPRNNDTLNLFNKNLLDFDGLYKIVSISSLSNGSKISTITVEKMGSIDKNKPTFYVNLIGF